MFDAYGKLQTGLVRLDLALPSNVDGSRNAGLMTPPRQRSSEWNEQDQVWKASKILDQLERFDTNQRGSSTVARKKTFGEIQSVPWLDKMTKEYCQQTLSEAREKVEVSFTINGNVYPSLVSFDLTFTAASTYL